MPTAFTAQNGIVIHQSTPIAVTGCPKAKKASRAKQSRNARAARRGLGYAKQTGVARGAGPSHAGNRRGN
jgi:hypothetical protein